MQRQNCCDVMNNFLVESLHRIRDEKALAVTIKMVMMMMMMMMMMMTVITMMMMMMMMMTTMMTTTMIVIPCAPPKIH